MTDTTSGTTGAAATPWPTHDPATRRWLPTRSTPVDPDRVEALLAAEWERFVRQTPDIVDGAVRGFLILVSDVTAIKEAELRLRDVERARRAARRRVACGAEHLQHEAVAVHERAFDVDGGDAPIDGQ